MLSKVCSAALLLLVLLIAVSIFVAAFPAGDNRDFVTFRESAVTNADFSKVISWARGLVLAGDQSQTNTQGSVKDVPEEVKRLFWKQDANPYIDASVHALSQSENVEKFVAINYMFSEMRYGFFIGSSNFVVPDNKVKCIWKYGDGVFCFKDY